MMDTTLTRSDAPANPRLSPDTTRDRLDTATRFTGWATLVAMVAMLALTFLYAPTERTQGPAQRIFYPHFGAALTMYVGYFLTFAGSIAYLVRRTPWWDVLAHASAEVSLLFTTIVLLSGSIWGKTIWGTWWAWDARLTSTLILWFIYAGYLMLRAYGGDTAQIARSAAVIGIVGFLDVPIINQSVRWWRTLHPAPIVERANPALPVSMQQTMAVALLALLLLFAHLLLQRLRLERLRLDVNAARQDLLFAD